MSGAYTKTTTLVLDPTHEKSAHLRDIMSKLDVNGMWASERARLERLTYCSLPEPSSTDEMDLIDLYDSAS